MLVYEERDPGFFIGVGTTASRAWITIECGDQETTETWLIPAGDPTAAPKLVAARDKGVRYSLSHWRERFIIRTNLDGAVDFKLMQVAASLPAREHWRDFVPHRPGHYIVRTTAFRDHFVYVERHEANNSIVIMHHDGATHAIAIDEPAFLLSVDGSYEYDTALLRTGYQSPTTPRQWFEYDMDTRERRLLKTQEVPSGHDPARYRALRLQARAPDGTPVPITVLMRHDTPVDGTAPLLLYGYGSYGHAIEPGFSIATLSLVDRGWVHAVAHIRGGSEKGWGWFLDGRGPHKPNSFTDFIACAEHLVEQKFADPARIVAQGGSAGGLLMGAACNLRPDLFAGIIAQVPFVDMLNTMSDVSLPLTPPEWPEWGNPITRCRGLRPDRRLLAVRQHPAGALPRHPGDGRPVGPAGHLLGTRQVGGEAARDHHRGPADPAAHQHGGRPRRRLRALREAEGDRAGAGLRHLVHRCRLTAIPAASRRSRRVRRGSPGTWAVRHASAARCRRS